jgi:hypothetical protein
MSEVDSAVEKFSHCYNRHGGTLLLANFFTKIALGYWANYLLTLCT